LPERVVTIQRMEELQKYINDELNSEHDIRGNHFTIREWEFHYEPFDGTMNWVHTEHEVSVLATLYYDEQTDLPIECYSPHGDEIYTNRIPHNPLPTPEEDMRWYISTMRTELQKIENLYIREQKMENTKDLSKIYEEIITVSEQQISTIEEEEAVLSESIEEIVTAVENVIGKNVDVTGINKFKSADVDDEGYINCVDQNDKKYRVSPGKFLKKVFPDMDDTTLNKVIGKLKGSDKASSNPSINFKLRKDAGTAIKELHDDNTVESGIVRSNNTSLLSFLNKEQNVACLVLYNGEKAVGRALIWANVKDSSGKTGTYMDRVYPLNNENVLAQFKKVAQEKGYLPRPTNGNDVGNLKVMFNDSFKMKEETAQKLVKNMDTFRYYYNGAFYSIPPKTDNKTQKA